MNETNWDGGATTWDRDWNGPGTRTIWDPLPAELKIDQLAVTQPSRWLAGADQYGVHAKVLPR